MSRLASLAERRFAACGPRYLLDSNLDWGQDLKRAAAWVRAGGEPFVCACYLGRAPLEYYGLEAPLPASSDAPEWNSMDCVALVSATPLFGLYVSPDQFSRLRRHEPIAKIGYSIYAFDLREGHNSGDKDPAGPGVYDDTDPHIRYRYFWTRDSQFKTAARGTLTYSRHRSAIMRFRFRGTGVCYVHTRAFNRGCARVVINGTVRGDVDLYPQEVQWQARSCFADSPTASTHWRFSPQRRPIPPRRTPISTWIHLRCSAECRHPGPLR